MNRVMTGLLAAGLAVATALSDAAAATSPARAAGPWVAIYNQGTETIVAVYLDQVGLHRRMRNALGGEPLQAGGFVGAEPYFHYQDECRFDVTIVYASGSEVELRSADLCEAILILVDEQGVEAI